LYELGEQENQTYRRKEHCDYNKKLAFKKLPEHFGSNSVVIKHTDRYSFLTTPGGGEVLSLDVLI
jgi:hypothetical protein